MSELPKKSRWGCKTYHCRKISNFHTIPIPYIYNRIGYIGRFYKTSRLSHRIFFVFLSVT